MLTNEFRSTWKDVYKEKCHGNKFTMVPLNIPVHFEVFAMAHYHRSELDTIVTGLYRHKKFVSWCMDNYSELSRIADREYHNMLSTLERMAETRHIKTPY